MQLFIEIIFLALYAGLIFMLAAKNYVLFERFSRGVYLVSFSAFIFLLIWNAYFLFSFSETELYLQHSLMCFCENFKPIIYLICILITTALANFMVRRTI